MADLFDDASSEFEYPLEIANSSSPFKSKAK
jgi:hypothetical protein